MSIRRIVAATCLLCGSSTVLSQQLEPPMADRKPSTRELHGETIVDEYAWLRDRNDPATIAYLEAENEYVKQRMDHTDQLQATLYEEMLARIKQTDLSVPYRDGPFYYYSRTVEGLDYPIFCRKSGSLETQEEILLDQNTMSEGKEYFRVTSRDISLDHRYLAYAVDLTGYETVSISVKDLATGQTYENIIEDAAPWGLAWSADSRVLFYMRTDETKRSNRVYRHRLGTPTAEDELILREDDVRFRTFVSRSLSDEMILMGSSSSTTSEVWFVPADEAEADPRVIAPREQGVQYSADHRPGPDGGWFYIVTDADDSPNFKLVTTPVASPDRANWTTM
ncbi:MAG: S9 family peptidase, partial [Planctomycetota bacterium]